MTATPVGSGTHPWGWAVPSWTPSSTACTSGWFLWPHRDDGDGGVPVSAMISSGPNKSLYYITQLKDSLLLAPQMHRDFKPGSTPWLYAVDTMATHGLSACGINKDTTIHWVNTVCKSTLWSNLLSHNVAHERCHMTRDSTKFIALNATVPRDVESVLATTSTAARTSALTILELASDAIFAYGNAIHNMTVTETILYWRPQSATDPTWMGNWFISGPTYNTTNCR